MKSKSKIVKSIPGSKISKNVSSKGRSSMQKHAFSWPRSGTFVKIQLLANVKVGSGKDDCSVNWIVTVSSTTIDSLLLARRSPRLD